MSLTEHRVEQLAQEAQVAARIRALKTNPDVVALHVERVRHQVEWFTWISIGLGLLFTLVNVQQFAAGDAPAWSFVWLTAWLLDPMMSLALIAVLRAEMVTARYQLKLHWWVFILKVFTLTATYTMNTWSSWFGPHASVSQVILHSAPVGLVFCATVCAPGLRDRLTEAVARSAEEASRLVENTDSETSYNTENSYSGEQTALPLVAVIPPPKMRVISSSHNTLSPSKQVEKYMLDSWSNGRRVEARELYDQFPDRKQESIRAVMHAVRKKNPGLEPPVSHEREHGYA